MSKKLAVSRDFIPIIEDHDVCIRNGSCVKEVIGIADSGQDLTSQRRDGKFPLSVDTGLAIEELNELLNRAI